VSSSGGDTRHPIKKGVSFVLTITPDAEQALDAVVAAGDAPEGAGVRISQGVGANGQPAIGLAVAPAPEVGDEVVEEANVPVFVAADVTGLLADKVLDARLEGDQIAFQIGDQTG
jgi:iron-sulfur cluster assembly protein